MTSDVPAHCEIVIVGGGIIGCSVAYHLTKLGKRDVVLLEQARLTAGTTWHAAGLVGQMRPSRNMTRMSRYGVELYRTLEAETGQATGWVACGSVNVARTAARMTLLRRTIAQAASFGVETHELAPAEIKEKWPLMRVDDLAGGIWLPGDGKANPTDLTQALAKGARAGGARLLEGVHVTGFRRERGRVAAVETAAGAIACDTVVLCAGQWSRQLGRMAGVTVPLHSAEHYYVVTRPMPGVTRDLPVMRDPDAFIYVKEEVGGLVVGGFEPKAKPWGTSGVPEDFAFQLLPEDWDQFQILMEGALHRIPSLAEAGIRQFLNGPESFTPDGNFILGEAPELAGFFIAAGFNSAGIANAGGAGRLTAEWIVGGEPPMDLGDVDIRRFARFQGNAAALRERTVETLGLHYAMRWPRHELESVRPLRRSPLYDRLAAKGARFGSKMGWERVNYFADGTAAAPDGTFGRPGWLDPCLAEQAATREAVAVFDQTSFAKLLVQGRDALSFLQRVCANDVGVAVDRVVYTAVLNPRGGFESDLTVMRTAETEFLIITGSGQATRDLAWLRGHIDEGENVIIADVTSAYAVLSVMGPKSRALMQALGPDPVDAERFPLGTARLVDVGYAVVRAARMSYVGGLGFELYAPTEFATGVYEAIHQAGSALGLADAGYYTLDALRIEAGRRAFGSELGPDETPIEAGLETLVAYDKGVAFIGRDALLRQRQTGPGKRLVLFAVDDPEAMVWGGEPILRNGAPVGEVTSAGFSRKHGRVLAMGYVRGTAPLADEAVLGARYELDAAGVRLAARASLTPFR